jgi:hypothetical protein
MPAEERKMAQVAGAELEKWRLEQIARIMGA